MFSSINPQTNSQITKSVQEITNLNTNKEKIVIFVDGRGGSGKSTITKLIGEYLNAKTIGLDEYTLHARDLFDPENIKLHFNIDFQNTKYNVKHIKELISNCSNKFIVIEGCFSFKNLEDINADYLIWIEIDKKTAQKRLNNREKNDESRKDISYDIIELSSKKWQESEDKYIKNFKPQLKADFIINNGS